MIAQQHTIDENALVTDIVITDYRTADVFRRYNIDFCCGGKWPLYLVCENQGLDINLIKKELQEATRVIHVSPSLPFHEWPLDFLADYLVYVHHAFLKENLPLTKVHLEKFVAEHHKKYSYLKEAEEQFNRLYQSILPHLQQEEEIIFPYIKRLNRAYINNESYAGLLVRTLRKPVNDVMHHEHVIIERVLHRLRDLTGNYSLPEAACTSHRVTFAKLRELDNDLVQHVHLENNILFPTAIKIEKELASRN